MKLRLPQTIPLLVSICALQLASCGPKATTKSAVSPPGEQKVAPAEATPQPDPYPQPPLMKTYEGEQAKVLGNEIEAKVGFYGVFEGKAVVALRLPEGWVEKSRPTKPPTNESFYRPPDLILVTSKEAKVEFFIEQDSDLSVKQAAALGGDFVESDTLWLLVDPEKVSQLRPRLLVNFDKEDPQAAVVDVPVRIHGKFEQHQGNAEATWGRALIRFMEARVRSPFGNTTLERLHALYGRSEGRALKPSAESSSRSRFPSDLSDLMSLASGARSVELALEHRSKLSTEGKGWKPSKKLATLTPPSARRHDWKQMLRGLVSKRPAPKITEAVPAEFYFVHAKTGKSLFLLLDELDTFLTPAAHIMHGDTYFHGLSERYQTMLGLSRGPLTRVLGPKAIDEMAIVGSDPFLRMGSDLTMIFEATDQKLLALGLAGSLARLTEQHSALTTTQIKIAGHAVRQTISKDGAIQQYYVQVGDRFIVSNSPAALKRVLQTQAGHHESLASEPDFQYMMNRDEDSGSDVLAFAGDKFIEAAVSPRSRILDARRVIAQSELRRIGHLAVMQGLFGRSIPRAPETFDSDRRFHSQNSKHFDGTKILAGPQSPWGTGAQMTPLIDLPTPEQVTIEEASAYGKFVRRYDRAWNETVDPIALRLRLDKDRKGIEAHLRILPLTNDSEYRSLQSLVGNSRVEFRGPALGLRAVLAIAKESELRTLYSNLGSRLLNSEDAFSWIGDYAMVGVEDRSELANALYDKVAPNGKNAGNNALLDRLGQIPLYAAVAVSGRAAADIAISSAKILSESMDGEIQWLESNQYAGSLIEALEFPRSHLRLYFSLGKKTLFFAFHERTIKKLLDLEKANELPVATEKGRAQWGLETNQKPGGALSSLLTWAFEKESEKWWGSAESAYLLSLALVGSSKTAPERLDSPELLSLLGALPVTPDGFFFKIGAGGTYDPQRWNIAQRRWPTLPVKGSFVDSVVGRLEQTRFEMSFDPEAPDKQGNRQDSLSIHLSIKRQ